MPKGCSARVTQSHPERFGDGLWRLIEASGIGALVVDELGIVVHADAAFHRALGVDEGELSGRGIDEFVVDQRPDISRRDVWVRTYRTPTRGAVTLIEAESEISLIDGATGRARVIVESRDARGSAIEAHARSLLGRVPCGIAVTRRADGTIVYVNSRLAQMLDRPTTALVGTNARENLPDDAQRDAVAERVTSNGSVTDMEVQLKRADGECFWGLLSLEPIEIEGEALNLICVSDHTEHRRTEETLREMASRDPLTGLHNRRSFMDLARQKLSRAERFKEPLSVLVIDVDHFKVVNDTWGHAVGDEALRMIADAFTDTLREYDVVARLGGEEFVVALSDTDVETALSIAERVRRRIGRTRFLANEGETFGLTISVGIARVEINGIGGRDDDLERAIHRADIALYRSKRLGRDRSSIFRPEVK